jgi:crotonobetainyl-CoA:carnitine CoA-transferase CaiB-like acyl-CoA transferase
MRSATMLYNSLSDIKVVDLTHFVAGPYATKLLADLGAEVIKVEPPWGEGGRDYASSPSMEGAADAARRSGALFSYLNANKLGVSLNLKHQRGRELLLGLLKDADLLVENFAPGTLEHFGLAPQELVAKFPRLSVVSISNFGQDGPDRDAKLNDLVLFARGGWSYAIGEPDRGPLTPPGSLAQYVGGLYAAIGGLQTLFARDQHGQGQQVDVSLVESTIATMIYETVGFQYSGFLRQRMGRQFVIITPLIVTLRSRDGFVGLHCTSDEQFAALCEFIGRPELRRDPRFSNVLLRIGNTKALQEIVEEFFSRHDSAYLYHQGQRRGVPVALIPTVAEVMEWEQLKGRRFFEPMTDGLGRTLMVPGPPLRLSSHRGTVSRSAPMIGEHNREILGSRLGLGAQDLAQMKEARII